VRLGVTIGQWTREGYVVGGEDYVIVVTSLPIRDWSLRLSLTLPTLKSQRRGGHHEDRGAADRAGCRKPKFRSR
jgi:hypothetical protein